MLIILGAPLPHLYLSLIFLVAPPKWLIHFWCPPKYLPASPPPPPRCLNICRTSHMLNTLKTIDNEAFQLIIYRPTWCITILKRLSISQIRVCHEIFDKYRVYQTKLNRFEIALNFAKQLVVSSFCYI
jgi:hypothetical protein